jgi:sugar phosphate isomerase/epimerase
MNLLSLDHLTVFEASPPEIVSIAAETGCQAVSLFIQKPNERVDVPPLITDAALRRETARRMADTGVRLGAIECFIITPETDIASFRPALEVGASLGGTAAATVAFDSDEARFLDNFAALCGLAAEYGLGANIEFLAFSPMNSIGKTERFLAGAGLPNAGIIVDSLHMVRTRGSPRDVASTKAGMIRYAQICDGPLEIAPELEQDEGLLQRRIPGEGAFPLTAFAAALPPDVTIGVEVPLKDLQDRGVGPLERARRAVEASRRIIAASTEARADPGRLS